MEAPNEVVVPKFQRTNSVSQASENSQTAQEYVIIGISVSLTGLIIF